MAWWSRKNKATELASEKRSVPTGLFIKCDGCSATVDSEKIRESLRCCPHCGYHFSMPTEERLALLLDDGSMQEQDVEIAPLDPLGFRDSKRYADRLVALQKNTGQADAFRSFLASVDGVPVSFGMFQFEFMGGSMGSVVGEKITRVFERAAEKKIPAIVLSNADFKRTLLDLVGPQHLPSEWLTRARESKMAAALFMTFLGVKGDLRDDGMRATNYWQYDLFDFDEIYRDNPAEPPSVRACYITSASLKDPDHALHHAPEGVTNVEVMTIVPGAATRWGVGDDAEVLGWTYRRSEPYREIKQRIEDELVARLDRQFPGTAARICYRESATPLSHSRFTRASDGSGYGLAATPDQFLDKRPGYRGPIDGLYLCGASTRAGHGIAGAMMSGLKAAQRILRRSARS